MGSILKDTKQTLGLDPDASGFDPELIIFINSVLSDMTQLGIGPSDGFQILDDSKTWADFLGTDPRLNSAQAYMHLCVKLLFDPPQTGPLGISIEKLKDEAAWRLTVKADEIARPPLPDSGVSITNVLSHSAAVKISGGNVSEIIVNGINVGTTYGTIIVPSGQTISLIYTVPPKWEWS